MSTELQIVVPMAGRGSRFSDAGFELPKPLIDVAGQPMIQWVVDNLRTERPHRFVFLCLAEHIERFALPERLATMTGGCEVVSVDAVTDGAACTVLLAREHIDNDQPLMIANSDQWVTEEVDAYLAAADEPDIDGMIMTMTADDPKWSFARLDERGRVTEVVEKQPISVEATVGIYNFARGSDYVRAADEMIHRDRRVNGEFYVAPVYNELIEKGANIRVHNIGAVEDAMWGLGTPADLELFLASSHASRT